MIKEKGMNLNNEKENMNTKVSPMLGMEIIEEECKRKKKKYTFHKAHTKQSKEQEKSVKRFSNINPRLHPLTKFRSGRHSRRKRTGTAIIKGKKQGRRSTCRSSFQKQSTDHYLGVKKIFLSGRNLSSDKVDTPSFRADR
mmetsp:Transcript_18028/g.15955  ORF Transcript_18028/g.15955 Transcript_18028/m.15955 type:complete len:140 (-) Transcript_18028:42-461(-)